MQGDRRKEWKEASQMQDYCGNQPWVNGGNIWWVCMHLFDVLAIDALDTNREIDCCAVD